MDKDTVNSKGAKVFRQRAAGVLRSYTLRGYVTAGKRTENGALPDDSYFELLLEEISEIRLSERGFYQMITTVIRR